MSQAKHGDESHGLKSALSAGKRRREDSAMPTKPRLKAPKEGGRRRQEMKAGDEGGSERRESIQKWGPVRPPTV